MTLPLILVPPCPTIMSQKKTLQDIRNHANKQAKALVGVLAETGEKDPPVKHIVQQLKELEQQDVQVSNEIESVEATISQLERRIISAETIAENLKTFVTVYERTSDPGREI